jgi:hypothetical protein
MDHLCLGIEMTELGSWVFMEPMAGKAGPKLHRPEVLGVEAPEAVEEEKILEFRLARFLLILVLSTLGVTW